MKISLIKHDILKSTSRRIQKDYDWPVLEREKLFIRGNKELIWKKYCGFLDFSIDEFMSVQKLLLKEQIELSMNSSLGQVLIGNRKPANMDEFRRFTPLTVYEDYQTELGQKKSDVLAAKPVLWITCSARIGDAKCVPFSLNTIKDLSEDFMTALILSSAEIKGDVRLKPGSRVMLNLPSGPITNVMGHALFQRLIYRAIPPLEESEKMDYAKRIKRGIRIGLGTGIDYAVSTAETLFETGEDSSWAYKQSRYSWHPLVASRLTSANIKSKLLKRAILPRDIWKSLGLLCLGSDAQLFRERIAYYWGKQPLEAYFSAETGFLALQAWNKKYMTFLPFRHFYEFIPQEEIFKSENNPKYQPNTVLYNELQPGRIYEVVITNFHGGPFLRYRLGDLIRVMSLEDKESRIKLPQVTVYNRARGTI